MLQHVQEGTAGLDRLIEPAGFERRQIHKARSVPAVASALRGKTSRIRDACRVGRVVALGNRESGRDERHDHQQREHFHPTPLETTRTAVLANVFAFELILRDALHRCSQIGDRRPEATVLQVEIGLVARPAEVEVTRLITERITERCGDRGAFDLSSWIPVPGTVRDDRQDPIRGLGREPMLELLIFTQSDWAASTDARSTNHSLSSTARFRSWTRSAGSWTVRSRHGRHSGHGGGFKAAPAAANRAGRQARSDH